MRCLAGLAVVALASSAYAEAPAVVPHTAVWPIKVAPKVAPTLVNSRVLFLNRCKNGCAVKPASQGASDSTIDQSDIAGGNVMLSAYNGGDSGWGEIVSCVKRVMSPFNITVTDVDPGTQPHFEVMVAGTAEELNNQLGGQGILGIADYACVDPSAPGSCYASFLPDALVFAFANDPYFNGDTNTICGTAAQEIAHAWTLDHTTVNTDPMTYRPYSTSSPLAFKNGATCGSDCGQYNGCSNCNLFGVTCSGSGLSSTHPCMSTGQSTQNEVDIITKIFGPAGAQAPTIKLKNPTNGSAQPAGFTIEVDCTSPDGIQEVDLSIDNINQAPLTTAPYTLVAPQTLTKGTHHIHAICGTIKEATATADADFVVGDQCATSSDCPTTGFICYEQACIAGPGAMGGLGASCTTNSDCSSMSCASDTMSSHCVIPCDLSDSHCPSGFACLQAGDSGVCWAGASNSSSSGGGCDSGESRGAAGSIVLGLGFAATLVMRRRRS
jgi:hypothetical protein